MDNKSGESRILQRQQLDARTKDTHTPVCYLHFKIK
uniref:Uncharacterized protein n=1 Tax=Rhizophora mucronata TaxID=61149 RepID=A0A2P2PKQ8_RHIMU